ncbi:hypothetical protein Q4R38_17350 [Morganella morganii]|uniref:hypothetical protein n=1 Tax=Morganella morganii TaxID=582 RepID=UPI0031ADE9A2
MIHIGVWRYYHCEKRAGKIISAGIIIAGVLVIVGVLAIDAVNYKINPYQESIGKYYSEECKPLVLSVGNADGKINIINCNETILQVDAAEYDNAIRAYNKSVSNRQG